MKFIFKCLLFGAGIFFVGCGRQGREDGAIQGKDAVAGKEGDDTAATLFRLLPPDSSSIYFSNNLTEGLNTNVLLYEYFYNGSGVAIGDMNGDGLQDIYFSGNMTENKLYLNKGHLHFEDITAAAGVGGRAGPWKTGVSVADVNGDGKPDIFVCYSGKLPGYKRTKQLFINLGNDAAGVPHFEEEAAQYGLADSAYTTQAYFFDYDRDGDLDLLVLNHNPNSLPVLNEMSTAEMLKKADPQTGPRLLRNDGGHFHDVTAASGINGSALSYGLGAAIADIDGDGWPDIYISNDYTIADRYYVNDHKGHFVDKLQESIGHISQFSMGNNVSDINNDGRPDIFTLDMLPEDNHRQKLLFAPDNYEKFNLTLRSGFYYQYMRNMLQLNNGDGHFSEIGQLAGLSNTDWSWAPLWADLDNDGWKDLFVTNGYVRDYTNMDFIKFMEGYTQQKGRLKREDVLDIIDHMPSSNVTSYLFRNNGDLSFTNTGRAWGIRRPSNSNGAAWVDLDNDGDLDLVVNNLNQPAFVYENRARQLGGNHFLEVKLVGSGGNTAGVGAKVWIYANGKQQYLEQEPTQGYESGVSPVLHFGLGRDSMVDSMRVLWPGGRRQVLLGVRADQWVRFLEKDAAPGGLNGKTGRSLELAGGDGVKTGKALFEEIAPPLGLKGPMAGKDVGGIHGKTGGSPELAVETAGEINDYKRQPLLVNPLSFSGPCMVKGDVNGDGLEDLFMGGGNGVAGAVCIQQKNGGWLRVAEPALEADKMYGDAAAVFFDANGDGQPDLYIASGGYHNFQAGDSLLQDRLYLGDGKGHFVRDRGALPVMTVAKSVVRVADINGDGYPDLFIGGRVIPGQYPVTPASYLLMNDGKGHFTDRTEALAPGLSRIGMVTDAVWADLDKDGKPELVLVGEWMPITVYAHRGDQLVNATERFFGKDYSGWWNTVWVGDLDGDGRLDLVAGNLGTNTQCKADERHPAELHYKDFDGNGTMDPILCFFVKDSSYPFLTRDELLQQVGNRSKLFPDYRSYADAGLSQIFSAEELKGAGYLRANCLRTALFMGAGDGKLHEKPLPVQAQYAPVWTITALDADKDGKMDLLLCGNINHARIRFGKYDANYGVLLKGDGKGQFSYVDQVRSGLHVRGDVRSVVEVKGVLLLGVNGEGVKAYRGNMR